MTSAESRASVFRTVTVETVVGHLSIAAEDNVIRPFIEENDGCWAPQLTRLFRRCLGPGMQVVDVGAHVGYFTLLAARLVGPDGWVFAFEPHPRNVELLLANVERAGVTNVRCFPWAVSDSCRPAELFEAADGNTGDHRLYRSHDDERTAVSVRAVALDGVAGLHPPVDFVKVDVQGAEEAAVHGMEMLLTASPEVTVAIEHWPFGMSRFGSNPAQVLAYYRRLGFVVSALRPEHDRPVRVADDEIVELCSEWDGYGHADLVLQRMLVGASG